MPNAIVIGGGPSGSMTALLLARSGWRVKLFEQHAFPRDKVCGECLSSLGVQVLSRAGLHPALEALHPALLRRVHLHGGGRSVSLPLPRPMIGLSRRLLDEMLLAAAARFGVEVHQRVRCEAIDGAGNPSATLRDLSNNRVWTESAAHFIIADGKGSLAGRPPAKTGSFGIKAHFDDVDGPSDSIELFGCQGCYGGIAAIEGNRWNASFSVPAQRLRRCAGNLEALFAELMAENDVLRQRLGSARRIGVILAAPLMRFGVRQALSARVLHVGGGAAALEPIGGEGMGLALRSAELAAEWLQGGGFRLRRAQSGRAAASRHGGSSNGFSFEKISLTRRYSALWRVRGRACRAAALLASSPPAARIALTLLDGLQLGGCALRLIGKT
jgi:flavin-dependent dehydrogenase